MWSWEAASRGLQPLWSWQDPDRRGKEEKTVKEELKLERETETEKSKSRPEMLARKDYIPFNRYNLIYITKYIIIYINSDKLYLKPF